MPFATTRRVGESVLACPARVSDRFDLRTLPGPIRSDEISPPDSWFARVILVHVSDRFVILRTESSEGVQQEVPVAGRQGVEFRTPAGECIAVSVRPRGSKASFVIEAPPSVLLIRSELEEQWRQGNKWHAQGNALP